jgi:hypothetical protein
MGEPPRPSDDIYSVGATLYDLLTSKPPFFTGSIHAQVIQATPQAMAERRSQLGRDGEPIPPQWEEVIAACLAKQPENRPATALEIIRRLESPSTTQAGRAASVEGAPRPSAPPPVAAAIPPAAPPLWQNIPPVPGLPGSGPGTAPQYGGFATAPLPPPPPARGNSPWMLIVAMILLGVVAIGGGIFLALRSQGAGGGTTQKTEIPTPAPATPSPPAVLTGRILVNSIPSGARVFLDGRDVGSSPVTLGDVEAGDHRLRLEKADYEPLDLAVHVEAGSTVDRGALALVALPRPAPPPVEVPPVVTPQVPPRPPPVVESGLTESAAREVAARYISFTQQRNVAGLLECYSDPVDYHDEGALGRTKLRASINSYFRDWPYFDIDVISSDVDATSDPDVKVVKVSYRFLAKSGSKISSGVAHDTLTMRRAGDEALIVRFRQTVTDRRKNF